MPQKVIKIQKMPIKVDAIERQEVSIQSLLLQLTPAQISIEIHHQTSIECKTCI